MTGTESSLMSAAKSGNLSYFIKAVMKGGADVNERDAQGGTALHYACMQVNRPLLRYLLSRADLDTTIRDGNGKTALQLCPKEKLQKLTVIFSKAQEKVLLREKRRKTAGTKRGEEENAEMQEETGVNEDGAVSPSTFRKLIVCIVLPLLCLFLYNGFFFTVGFIFLSLLFYFISFAYFVSEVAVRPPWYHHQPGADHLITHGNPDYWQNWINNPGMDFGLAYREIAFESTDKYTLRGWYVPPPTTAAADAPRPNPSSPPGSPGATAGTRAALSAKTAPRRDMALVLVHGAGRDRRAWHRHVPFLHNAGYGCLLFDMREHGLSDGKMRGVTYGMAERYDVISAARYLRSECGYEKVGVVGTSVGGASVIMAAGIDRSIDLVIAENAMTTSATMFDQQIVATLGGYFSQHEYSKILFRVFRKLCTWWLNVRIRNKPSKHCQALHCIEKISPRPVMIMHGTSDVIVPCRHAQILYDTAKEPKELYICEGAFHCGLYNTAPEEFEGRVLGFLDKYSDAVVGAKTEGDGAAAVKGGFSERMGDSADNSKTEEEKKTE